MKNLLRSNKIGIFLIVLTGFLAGSGNVSFGQAVGDYGTRYNTGTSTAWAAGSNWVICTSAGTWTGATTASAAPINTKNVWIRGGANYSVTANSTCLNLNIASTGALVVGGNTFTVSGSTSNSGDFSITSNTSTKTFTGLVTMNSGGTWTSTTATTVSRVVFKGGITNNSSNVFAVGGATFNTIDQNLGGTGSFSFVNATVTGVNVTNNSIVSISGTLAGTGGTLTNAGTVNTSGASLSTIATLTNTGTFNMDATGAVTAFTNSINGVLNIGATPTIPTITTLTANAANNTVNYDGPGNQGIKTNTYVNLTVSGSGTKTLAAATPTVSGVLTVKAGTTLALSSFALGGTTAPSSVVLEIGTTGSNISGTGALNLGGSIIVNATTGTSGATISCPVQLDADRTFTIADDGTTASDLTISGVISTSFGLTKADAGSLILSGANTYTGATTVSNGVLNIQNATALGTTAAGTTVSNLAALQIQGGITVAEAITLQSPGISSDGGIRNISGNNTLSGLITLSGSSYIASDAGLLTLNVASGNAITGTYNLNFSGAGNTTVADPISTSSAILTKDGTGTLTLSATNTYAGTTTVNEGTLSFAAFGSNGFAGSNGNGTLVLGGGTLQYTGSTASTVQNITLTSGTASSIDVASGTTLTMSGANPASTGSLTKLGAGTLVLSGTSSFTGGTTITEGDLTLGSADKLDNSGAIILNGGTLSTGASTGFTETIGTLDLAANSSIALGTGSHTLTFANSSAVAWTGSTMLTITGWTGAYDGVSSGTSGKIFIESSSSGITAGQLAQIQFFDGSINNPAIILSTGEVVGSRNTPSNLSYITPNTFTKNTAITNLSPTVTGVVTSYTVSPSLPAGLSLNTTTGVISGTPTASSAATVYTITASNSIGSTTCEITITVLNSTSTYFSRASGDWDSNTTWSYTSGGAAVGAGIYPLSGDIVTIEGGFNVTLTADAACGSITFTAATATSLTLGGYILDVSGAVTIPRSGAGTNLIAVGSGTLNAGSIAFTNGGGGVRHQITISNGTVTVAGDITTDNTGASASITFTGAGTLNVGGQLMSSGTVGGTLTTFAGSTVNYNGAVQTVKAATYLGNLTLSGSGAKTTTGVTVNGILSLEGTATVSTVPTYGGAATLQYNTATPRSAGVEWISPFIATGGVIIANTGEITLSGGKIFGNNTNVPLTINNGASLSTSASNYSLTFRGDFINNGTLTASASPIIITGTTATQNIGGFTTTGLVSMTKTAGTATFAGDVSGAGLTINGTGGTLNLGTGLTHTFTGTFTRTAGTLNGGSSTLKLGSGFSGTGGTFTAGTGTVEWNAAANQTIAAVTYNNLILSGSGAKSIASLTSVVGNLSIAPTGSATASIAAGQNIVVGSLTLGSTDRACGTWGGTGSGATNINTIFFAATTGYLTVGTIPSEPTGVTPSSGVSICNGSSTNLNATSSGNTINWYTVSTGGTSIGNSVSGANFTVSPTSSTTYYAEAQTSGGCVSSARTATSLITVSIAPTASAGGTQTICQDGTATVSGASSSNGTILWTENGAGSITSGATTLAPTYTAAAGDAGNTVTLTMTVSNSPCSDAIATYSVVVKVSPTASAGGTQTICQNGTATVSGASSSNGTILWTENGAGSITSGATTLAPTYTAAAGDAGNTVTLTMTVSNSPCSDAIATYSVVVKASPTASAGGTQTICQNGTATVSGASSSNGTILWTENGAGSITSGATTLTPTYTAAAGDAGNTVTLTMTVSNSPCSDAIASYSVLVKASPTASAGGTQTICQDGTATVSGASSANGTILWTENGSGSITSGATTLTPTYTAAAGDAGNTVTLTMTVSNSPCSDAIASYSVFVKASPTASAGGTQTICQDGTATVSGASSSNGTILWTEDGSGSITSGATTLTPTYTAASGDAGNTVTLTMTVSNSPCSDAIATYSVVVKTSPTASAAGPDQTDVATCGFTSITLAGNTPSVGTGTWSILSGTGGNIANAASPTSNFTGLAGTSYTLRWTISNSPCTASTDDVVITFNPTPTISISNAATCAPDLLTYSVEVTVSSGTVTSTTGTVANTSGNLWTISAVTSGTDITLTVTDGIGCQKILAVTAPVCSCPVISAPVSGGDLQYCTGSTKPALSASVGSGETVDWYSVSSGGTSLGSGTSYTAASAGVYYAEARNTTSNCKSTTRTPVTLTENPNLPASVSIAANPSGAICAGTNVTFTAIPTNGGAAPTYEWYNGANPIVGETSATYASTALANGNAIKVQMTSNATPCLTGNPATSNTITMTVNPNLTPTASITALPDGAICAGTSVTFTAASNNIGGGSVNYNFKIDGSSIQNGASNIYTSTTLANSNAVTCDITVTGGTCLTMPTATSNTITMTVNPNLTPTVTIAALPDGAICAGTSVAFTAASNNIGGGSVNYNFKIDGSSIQNGASNIYTSTTLANSNAVTCDITVTGGTCLTMPTATSNTITMTVNPNLTPTVTIAALPDGAICAGTSVAFTAASNNIGGGTVNYNFKIDGSSIQNGASNIYTSTTLANSNAVTCDITVTGGTCLTIPTATSNTITMTVNPNLTPTVSIAALPVGAICAGTSVTFTAASNNIGGGSVNYNFKIDGSSIQNGASNIYTSTTLANSNAVTCDITVTGGTCLTIPTATSNTITMTVNPNLTPTASITALPDGAICAGTSVTFTAASNNIGGGSVNYNFKIEGSSIQNGASNIYTSTTLANSNAVTCDITVTGGTCLTIPTATSNTITMTVNPNLTPTVTIAALPDGAICAGTSVTFTAASNNIGGGSVNYNFKIEGSSIQNGASNIYTSTTLANSNAVTCDITVTGGTCLTIPTATSNTITMTVNPNLTPTVTIAALPDGAICAGTSVTFTAASNNIGGGSVNYNFKIDGSSIQNGASNIYTSTTLANSNAVTCDITVTGGTCLTIPTATSNTITMTVNPNPAITPMTSVICSEDGFVVIPIDGENGTVPSGTTYSWPAPSGTGFTDGAASTGSPANITGTLFNTTSVPVTATYQVTPTSGTCSGSLFTVTITVDPKPVIGSFN